jgi:hypothetical protein
MKHHNYRQTNQIRLRWHYTHEGRTYIVYAANRKMAEAAALAHIGKAFLGCLRPSGYYCRKTNTIVNPQDGPITTEDFRKSGM